MSSDMIYSPLWVQRRLISARLRRASILANSGPRSASSTRAREYKRMSARPGYCWFGAEASGGPSTRSINVGVQPRRIKAWRLNAVMSRREGRTRIHSTPADLPFNAAQIADHLAEVAGFTFQALIPDQLISNRQRFGQVGMRAAQDGQEMIVRLESPRPACEVRLITSSAADAPTLGSNTTGYHRPGRHSVACRP